VLAPGSMAARPFKDHDVSPRMVKGRSMLRLAQRVASVVSCRPARCRAPTARFLRVAMARGPERVPTVEWSSRWSEPLTIVPG